MKGLARSIEAHLVVLESLGVTSTRASESSALTDPADVTAMWKAKWAIGARTNNAICIARDTHQGERPGIDLVFSYGAVRTGQPDVVAGRAQTWLNSPLSENLVQSLADSIADERHAVLWYSTEAEVDSAREQGEAFRPSVPLSLPAAVDVLWLFIGPVALRYNGMWTASLVAGSGVSAAR